VPSSPHGVTQIMWLQVTTLLDYLNLVVELPERDTSKPLRVPISGIYKIKGVGDVLAGRVEQGVVKPNDEVRFMPTHTAANKCEGKACGSPVCTASPSLCDHFARVAVFCSP
jgi:translation elongation factor EF-1alpha